MPHTLFPRADAATKARLEADEMVRLADNFGWDQTELGPISTWPEALRASVRLMMVSDVPMVMLAGAHEGVLIYNSGYAQFAGDRHPEIFGRPVLEAWPEIADFNREVMRRGFLGESWYLADQELVLNRTGRFEPVWLNLNYSPVLDETGTALGVVVLVVETTARVRAEMALAKSQEKLNMALTASGMVGTWDWDVGADLVTADERFARLYAIAPEDAERGFPISTFLASIHPDDRERAQTELQTAVASRGQARFEFRLLRPDGSIRWVAASGAVSSPKGLRFPGIVVDITEQRLTAERLAESEARFRTLSDSVASQALDSHGEQQDETYWDYPDAPENLGYYKSVPELKSAIDSLAVWTAGKGTVADIRTTVILESLTGWGEDTFSSIMQNLIVQKKVFGDAFAEIIRDEETGELINLKPLYPGDMRTVVGSDGIIERYEQRTRTRKGGNKKFQPFEILHLVNDRIGNEIHGVSVIEVCKWVIDARNEAMRDRRTIMHRMIALGILELDTQDPAKIAAAMTAYQNAVKNGEVLVLPKGVAELKENPVKVEDHLPWIQYLEGFFYQAVRVPRVIASSQDYTEAASKVGFMTFEPVYTNEQTLLEADLWRQLGLRVMFNRPPSLGGITKCYR